MSNYIDLRGVEQSFGDSEAQREVRTNDRGYVFHTWSAQGAIKPLPVAKADGVRYWDYDGHEYLDFSSQLVYLNLGHRHPKLIQAMQKQAARLPVIQPGLANDVRGELAKRIVSHAFQGARSVFFTNGGADANEHAVRMARHHTGRQKVLARYRSYHGATATAISLTGEPRRWANGALDTGVVHFFGPYLYRSAFGARTPEEEATRSLAYLRHVIELEGPQTIAAIIVETVTGTNGILVPPPGYLLGVRKLCDEFGIVMICDEVMAGFGRTGEWFAFQGLADGTAPDLVTFAKGVTSGYIPLGGVVVSEAIHNSFVETRYPGGLTYSGHPMGCAVGVAVFDIFKDEGILERVRDLGARVVAPGLKALMNKHLSVGEVRGKGLFWALELVRDRATREMLVPYNSNGAASDPNDPAAAPMNQVLAACKTNGLMTFAHFNCLFVAPPLTITEAELGEGFAIIDKALDIADKFYSEKAHSL